MLRKANNVFSVIVDDNAQAALGLSAGTLLTDVNLPAGAIALADLGNRFLTAAAYTALGSTDQFRILQGKGVGVPMMKSPILTKGNISITTAKHKAKQEQITVIGYNGTTGSLPVSNNTDFWIKLRKRDNDAANRSQPMSLFAGPVKTDSTATQVELAFLLAKSGRKNFALEPANNYVKFEVISDGTAAAIGTTTLAVTNGSNVATYSAAHSLAVGDLIFIAGATYQVKTVTSTTVVVLSTVFEGTTASALATGTTYATNHGKLTSVVNCGIRITGKPAAFDVNAFRDYYANRFTATFSDSSTLVTSVQGAFNGNGTFQQVAMDEYMSYGFEGQNNQLAVPSVPRDAVTKIPGVGSNTALTSKYSAVNIAWEERQIGIVSTVNGKGNVLIYVNLLNSGGTGTLSGGTSSGKELVTNLGLTASNLNE